MTGRIRPARAIALGAPAALLLGALGFQFLGGLPPCEMCVWQRWPLVAALLFAAASLGLRRRAFRRALLMSAAFGLLVSAVIGGFHAGVEYRWWPGITGCATGFAPGGSDADILQRIMAAPIVRCDMAPWSLFGVSLAGLNFLLSGVAGLAVAALVLTAHRRAE